MLCSYNTRVNRNLHVYQRWAIKFEHRMRNVWSLRWIKNLSQSLMLFKKASQLRMYSTYQMNERLKWERALPVMKHIQKRYSWFTHQVGFPLKHYQTWKAIPAFSLKSHYRPFQWYPQRFDWSCFQPMESCMLMGQKPVWHKPIYLQANYYGRILYF